MALVFLDNMCFTLTNRLDKTDYTLPISNSEKSALCEKLGSDGHSYLTLTTNLGTEIIRVECQDGEPFIMRGAGDTEPLTGSVGRCLCFKVNELVLNEHLPQDFCQPTVVSGNEDYIEITPPEEDGCEWTVNLSQALIDRLNECCPVDDCDCGNCIIADGTYENATITVIDGKVCAVENGKNIVYTGGSCCSCNSCENSGSGDGNNNCECPELNIPSYPTDGETYALSQNQSGDFVWVLVDTSSSNGLTLTEIKNSIITDDTFMINIASEVISEDVAPYPNQLFLGNDDKIKMNQADPNSP